MSQKIICLGKFLAPQEIVLSLEYLSLQGNSFEGSLPSSMAYLKGLQFLDVSRNHLSRSTPKGLEKLPFLKKLNLLFNDIEGEVSTEGVFKNASAISVNENSKLCGGVPQLQLPPCPVKVMKPRKSLSFKLIIAIAVVILCSFYFHSFLFLFGGKNQKGILLLSQQQNSFQMCRTKCFIKQPMDFLQLNWNSQLWICI